MCLDKRERRATPTPRDATRHALTNKGRIEKTAQTHRMESGRTQGFREENLRNPGCGIPSHCAISRARASVIAPNDLKHDRTQRDATASRPDVIPTGRAGVCNSVHRQSQQHKDTGTD